MKYIVNIETDELIPKSNNLGEDYRKYPYRDATDEENTIKNLEEAKIKKLLELDSYHNSETTRSITINGHIIQNTFEFRSLIGEQKDRFAEKIALGLIQEVDAIFNYRYNGSGLIPINYTQLRYLSVALKDLADTNYLVRGGHRDAIRALTSIDDIVAENGNVTQIGVINYDFTINYVINQVLSI